jgi:hypothetical protein
LSDVAESQEVPEVVVVPIKAVENILTDEEKYGKLKPKKGWSGTKGVMGRKIDKEKHARETAEINKRINEEAMKITRTKLEANYKLPTLATCPGLTFLGFQGNLFLFLYLLIMLLIFIFINYVINLYI